MRGYQAAIQKRSLVCVLHSVVDDDAHSMVSQYTIATASQAGTWRGSRATPAGHTAAAAPQSSAGTHRARRWLGQRAVVCLAVAALAAGAMRVSWAHRAGLCPARLLCRLQRGSRSISCRLLCLALKQACIAGQPATPTASRRTKRQPARRDVPCSSSTIAAASEHHQTCTSAMDAHYNLFPSLPPPDINAGRG